MEQQRKYTISLAGIEIPLRFRFPETVNYFKKYLCSDAIQKRPLYVNNDLWERLRDAENEKLPGSWTEFYQLSGLVSRFLLNYNCCIYHGAAFYWHGMAWIITAPSGVGKTTQLFLWQKLFGTEIEVINGDKPVIKCCNNGTVFVYPSPWNGKEGFSGDKTGRLGGIIILEQSDHNEIKRLDVCSSMIPIYRQFLYYADYEDEIRAVGYLQKVILQNIPIWKLYNLGDEASAKLTHDVLECYLEE